VKSATIGGEDLLTEAILASFITARGRPRHTSRKEPLMNIVVIAKQVPDTEARLTVANEKVQLEGVNMVINPFDEYGLEEALRIKDSIPDVKVFVLMVGPETARKNLVNCLALGADEAVLIADDAAKGSDPHSVARILVEEIKKLEPTVVFAGKQGVDYDWGLAAIAVAELLGWPHVGVCKKFTPDFATGAFTAVAESDEGDFVYEGSLPLVLTAEKGLNEPRYASLKGIMGAKKKPFAKKTLSDVGVDADRVGSGAASVEEVRAFPPPEKAPGRIIEGETVEERVSELVRALREEAKVL